MAIVKNRRIKKPVKILIALILILIGFLLVFKFETSAVNNDKTVIQFEVKKGSNYNSIASSLKEKNLIKSELFYKIYVKLNNPKSLQEGIYDLRRNMSLDELVKTLSGVAKQKYKNITFKEGLTFTDITGVIVEKTKYTDEDIKNLFNDNKFLDSLIKKYWFLTDDIKKEGIYYPLEGYLFPDTYQVTENMSLEQIFEMMLDETNKKLEPYKKEIEKNNYSIHELMTMASVIEKESSNSNDRKGVAGVFYNRLNSGMSLGSDVTTYYGLQIKLTDRDLNYQDLESVNGYNTRNANMVGKLPVGPICMPGIESIKASISPTEHDYFFFVADKNGKTYFNKTNAEHDKTIDKLKRENLWFEY